MSLKRKTNKGITLIALVITIIVLIILAGVTLGALTGENRNFNKSNRSKRENRNSRNNRRNTEGNTLAHAELTAIKKASKKTGDWRLEDCTMYVTLEPCQMCAGAIVQSSMKRVVIASMNAKAGCAGSVLNLLQMQQFNHQVEITQGVLEEECSRMLSSFFRELRERKKQAAQPAET